MTHPSSKKVEPLVSDIPKIIAGVEKIERGIGTMAQEYWGDNDAKPLAEAVALLHQFSRLRSDLEEALGHIRKLSRAGVSDALDQAEARTFISKHEPS